MARPVPSTAGMPYSRATIAQWLSTPPVSATAGVSAALRLKDQSARSAIRLRLLIPCSSL